MINTLIMPAKSMLDMTVLKNHQKLMIFFLIIFLTGIPIFSKSMSINLEEIQNNVKNSNTDKNKIFQTLDFENRTKISQDKGAFATVVTDNEGGVYVAFQSGNSDSTDENNTLHVYFVYSLNYGESWSETMRINDNESSSVSCDTPSIAIDPSSGYIYVAWKDNRTGVSKVYIDKSTDRGKTFGTDVLVYDWNYDLIDPWLPYTVNVKVDKTGKVYLGWIGYDGDSLFDSELFFAYSTDYAVSFSTTQITNDTNIDIYTTQPWIVIGNENTIYLAYCRRNSTIANVFIIKSSDGGFTFEQPVKINDGSTQRYTGGIRIAITSQGVLHAVWTDGRNGIGQQYMDIYYASSSDGGETFSENFRVNDDLEIMDRQPNQIFTKGSQGSSFVVVDSNSTIHIVWEDFRNYVSDSTYCRDIYYASINGSTISTNIKINYLDPNVDSVNAADPYLTVDSFDNFYLVYSDAPSGDNSKHFIFFQSVINSKDNNSATSESPTNETTINESTTNGTTNAAINLIPFFTAVTIIYFRKRIKSV